MERLYWRSLRPGQQHHHYRYHHNNYVKKDGNSIIFNCLGAYKSISITNKNSSLFQQGRYNVVCHYNHTGSYSSYIHSHIGNGGSCASALIYSAIQGRAISLFPASTCLDGPNNNNNFETAPQHHQRHQCRWFSSTEQRTGTKIINNSDSDNDSSSFIKKDKEIIGRRRVAAQLIPMWLKKEPEYFEYTVRKALNQRNSINDNDNESSPIERESWLWDGGDTGNSNVNNINGSMAWEYKKLFLDSIPSLMNEVIYKKKYNFSKIDTSLDILVEIGFSNVEWTKKYRSMKDLKLQQAQSIVLLQMKMKDYKQRKAYIDQLQKDFKKVEEDKNVYLQNLEEKEANNEDKGVDLKIKRFEKTIKKRKSNIMQHEKAIDKVLDDIEHLRGHIKSPSNSLSYEESEKAEKAVKDVMFVICDTLAERIAKQYSEKIKQYKELDAKTDLTKPQEWYVRARLFRRKVIFHGGPTNSGKTYTALNRLKEAKKGLYLGPLRLLAAEIFDTLTSAGIYTNLLTGQDKQELQFATHSSATVEMFGSISPTEEFDVVVIDEIQMIADEERGFAWTRALLGLQCKEIHVCGGFEAKDLIQRIVESCGDEFIVNQYERLSPLKVSPYSLSSEPEQLECYRYVRPGDCIVAFSRNDIFSIKREIEKLTDYKVCVIYGSLPPQTRTTQARLFNDPNSGYDILVASDAIGMGLNLNINRIIFHSLFKHNGEDIVRIGHSLVKQISGRAGRHGGLYSEGGEVTTRDPQDLQYLKDCIATEVPSLRKAGLIPTASHIESYSEALMMNKTSRNDNGDEDERSEGHLHNIIRQFSDMAVIRGDYFLCRLSHIYHISKWLQHIPISLEDKYTFCLAPVSFTSKFSKDLLVRFAQKLAAGEVPGLSRGMNPRRAKTFSDLSKLCNLHSELELFIWLQNKFPPCNFMEQQAALARVEMAVSLIAFGLEETDRLQLNHCHIKRDKYLRDRWEKQKSKVEAAETDEGDDDGNGNFFANR